MYERNETKAKVRKEGREYPIVFITDDGTLKEKLIEITAPWNIEPENATLELLQEGDDKFEITDEKHGMAVNVDELFGKVKTMLDNNQNGSIDVPHEDIIPEFTRENLEENSQRIARATTEFKSSGLNDPDRVFNIAKAAEMINRIRVMPGEEFAINAILGNRNDPKNGWKNAHGIREGVLVDEPGGGICQVSTTLYNAVLKADLEVTNRKHHSWPSKYVDIGKDATISTGAPDFKFVNNKQYPIYIFTTVSKENKTCTVGIYGPPLEKGLEIVFMTEVVETDEPKVKAEVTVSNGLGKGEYKQLQARRDYKKVKRWLEYRIKGKETVIKELDTDEYAAMPGKYIIGPNTPRDPKTNVPQGTKVADDLDIGATSPPKSSTPKPETTPKPSSTSKPDATPKPTEAPEQTPKATKAPTKAPTQEPVEQTNNQEA